MKKILLFAFVSMFAVQAHASTEELIGSVKSNNFPKVLELLNNGENVNEADASGTTALHYAVAYDNAEMTQVLLSYGADLTKANAKGWTPLKIAEQKDLKNVTPVLVQYLQLQKQNQEEKAIAENENNKSGEEQVVESVEIVQDAVAANPDENTPVVQEVVVSETVESEPVVQNADEQAKVEETPAQEVPVITMSEYQNMVNDAQNQIAAAKEAQTQAENNVNTLNDEIARMKAENEALSKALAEERENKAKAQAEAQKSTEVENSAQKTENKSEKQEDAVKSEPKQIKPVLQKKPAYKAPKPVAQKVVIKPSVMVDGIYAGDEEIVYCLDYLGNGDGDNLKRAAGHFAASVSISEARYKQIVDKANEFFLKAGDDDMNKRNDECSKIVFPADKNKQNQIIRSMNKSVGY